MKDYLFGGNREKAIKRDGYKCVRCGMTRKQHKRKYGKDITVDHMDGKGSNVPKEEKNNSLENLQTLCISCHSKKDYIRRTHKLPKDVWQMTLDGNKIKKWPSMNKIEVALGFHNQNIRRCLIGTRKTYKGYRWEFA